MENKCDRIVFRNIGDTTLTIYHVDSILKPFSGNISYPDTLAKGDSIEFTLCYRPVKSGADSQRVFLRADTRLSSSIAMLFDISNSMNDPIGNETLRKLDAAVAAGRSLIKSMLATPKVWDECGIYSFARNFYVNCDFSKDKTLLNNSLPTTCRPSTAFYDACIEVINRLKNRPYQKVMIALSDGEDNSSTRYGWRDVITQANAAKIKVYTVGVGSSVQDNILDNIARSTGGEFFKTNSSKGLEDIYYRIFYLLSKNIELYFDLLGNCPGTDIRLFCDSSAYVHPGDTVSFIVHNDNVSQKATLNESYRLRFRFNPRLLLPVQDSLSDYNDNGVMYFNGVNTKDLDSLPLAEVRFVALLGDSDCTDLTLESLTWGGRSDKIEIASGSSCRVCISSCARSLSQVLLRQVDALSEVLPNPAGDKAEFLLDAVSDGEYRLSIYNSTGIDAATIIAGELKPGKYTFSLDLSTYTAGLYYLVLSSPSGVITKKMLILK